MNLGVSLCETKPPLGYTILSIGATARIVGIFCIVISCEISRQYRDIVAEFHDPFAGSTPSCASSESARILTTSVCPFLLHGGCCRDGHHGRSAKHRVIRPNNLCTCVTDHFQNHDTVEQRYRYAKSVL